MKTNLTVVLSLISVTLLLGGCIESTDEASEPQEPRPEAPVEPVGPPKVEGLVEPKPEYEALDYCVQYFPEGLIPLTDAVKESVIAIALDAFQKDLQKPSIQERLRDEDITNYWVSEIDWYGIEWSDVERTESKAVKVYPYCVAETGMLNCIPPEDMEFSNIDVIGLSEEAVFYPGVTIGVGEYHEEIMQAAVDLDEGKIVLKWGLMPSLSSPDRFEGRFLE